MSERDTQFSGFAKLLWSDILAKIATIEMSPDEWIDGCQMCSKPEEEVTALIEPLIAERAYDLKEHIMLYAPAVPVPDMTEWPKTDG